MHPSPSKHKRSDSQQPPSVEVSSEIKKVEDVQNRSDVEGLKADDSGTETIASTLPSVDTLHEDSDVSAYMSPGIHENLRQMALRKLFHLPKFNHRDGLDDYDDDYRTFKPLGDILTSDRRHQLERVARGINPRKRQVSDSTAKAPVELRAEARSRQSEHLTPGQAGGPTERKPCIAADCVLCRRPAGSANRTREAVSCGQWFEQCLSHADPKKDDTAQIAMGLNHPTEIPSAKIQVGSPSFDALGGGLSIAVHAAIKTHIEFGEGNPVVVFHDTACSFLSGRNLPAGFPKGILWFSAGFSTRILDLWLSALAWGADRVVVVVENATKIASPRLKGQMDAVRAILDGLELERERLGLIELKKSDPAVLSAALAVPSGLRHLLPADFKPGGCGRATTYLAVDALRIQTASVQPAVRLPQGLPFGEVRIDSDACTLCMACVGACPTEALIDGGYDPHILFQEARCIQCGRCQTVCPETAIGLIPQMVFNRQARQTVRRLNQADAVGCVVCGRPFAVGAMVDKVAQRLANHWMYQSDAAKRRLQMCRDCRAQDFIRENGRLDGKKPLLDGQ